ncbi:non-ribosomal peptide synthetase [Bacillus cereus]|uniref:non-ribosomal peptide synthetase n=1 Tax=Bacillus cereus TaxID=1396 RepID=UPI00124445A9|nr:amino acid adenylation domain-containing protein [Bacillus cereus]MCU5475452.1 non-ribosomal peptide synthetase [Bacillus cereus]MCU5614887.1 non-ribosomal peptide synthetase [Bacillus cereus]
MDFNAYETSSAQKRLYLIDHLIGPNILYNMPSIRIIEGLLDVVRLKEAFSLLAERHEGLRTTFIQKDGEVLQLVHERPTLSVKVTKKSKKGMDELVSEFIRPFDLSEAPLWRAEIVQLEDNRYILLFDIHHIISDGVTTNIIFDELIGYYQEHIFAPLEYQYVDYAIWQNDQLSGVNIKKQEEFWLKEFSDNIPLLDLPIDRIRSKEDYTGAVSSIHINSEVTNKLMNLCSKYNITLYMVLLTVYSIFLSKYSGQKDLVIGTPVSGRSHQEFEGIVGMFVNTLAIRQKPEGSKYFAEYLKEVADKTFEAFENQDYPFEMLVEKLNPDRIVDRNPLFDACFILEDARTPMLHTSDLKIVSYPFEQKISKFDLSLFAREHDGGLSITMEYKKALFTKEKIQRMLQHFAQIADIVSENPGIKIDDISILTEEEKVTLLQKYNNSIIEYPRQETINRLFEKQAVLTPDKTAIVFNKNRMTYRELNEKANQLARQLREKGVQAESVVGILGEPSLETMIGILAILKAGGAYLAIDPQYPMERIKYLLSDGDVHLCLLPNDNVLKERDFLQLSVEIIALNNEQLYQGDVNNLPDFNNAQNLMYVIYTSGSTGKPKGVMVEHRAFTRFVLNPGAFNVFEQDKVLQTCSLSFDVSVFELWGTLLSGATLYLINKEDLLNPKKLEEQVKEYGITFSWFTASLLNHLVDENVAIFKGMRLLIAGGESLSPKHINILRNTYPDLLIINGYGPSENTIFTTFHVIQSAYDKNVPIGKSTPNTEVYILDDNDHLQPVGVPGELCIGGDGLARGYLARPELTAEKFLPSPFKKGERIYRSGDIARWLSDGTIEYLGRKDSQVKIRGFRVEMGEIEAQLLKINSVKEAVVTVFEDERKRKYLCAYVVCEDLSLDLRERLRILLPDYMIPSFIIKLDKLPLNQNGKVDRNALPKPNSGTEMLTINDAPITLTEKKLSSIWSEILHYKQLDVNSNFFSVGGHSLLAMVLLGKVKESIGIELTLRNLFDYPTIKEMAKLIDSLETRKFEGIEVLPKQDYYEVSYLQESMYLVNEMGSETAYNMPLAFNIEGKVDIKRLKDTLSELISRHESFRTSFSMVDGKIVQTIHPKVDFDLEYIDATNEENVLTDMEILDKFIRPFDLNKAPLLRAALVNLDDSNLLFFDMHHIISDGDSVEIFIREFVSIYQGESLEPLRIHYKEFVSWQNNVFTSEYLKEAEDYWLNQFSGDIPKLNLTTDFPRKPGYNFKGETTKFVLGKELTESLKTLANEKNVTLYMLLLAAYNVLLSKYCNQEDIVIGTPMSGRVHPDIEQTIGMFVNTVALRNFPSSEKLFSEFLEEVKQNLLDAHEYENYPFGKLNLLINEGVSPLFSTMFLLERTSIVPSGDLGISVKSYDYSRETAKLDLVFAVTEKDQDMILHIQYRSDLYHKQTMEQIGSHFINLLEILVDNPNKQLGHINILSNMEQNRILYDFNDTSTIYPRVDTVHRLFERQVELTPNKTAIVFEENKLTYDELNTRANQLARYLREKGVQAESVVGILGTPSLETMIGILAILKAGGAYLSIDPKFPMERIKYLLSDSEVEICLLPNDNVQDKEKFLQLSVETLFLNDTFFYQGGKGNLPDTNNAQNLMYIIYTSGSTGDPKGVMVEHQAVTRVVLNPGAFNILENERVLQTCSLSFDVSVFELWSTLLNGATLYFIDKERLLNAGKLEKIMEDYSISLAWFTTSLLNQLIDENLAIFKGLRTLISGGESLSLRHINLLHTAYPELTIINGYGPTEGTIFTSFHVIEKEYEKNIPIGRPAPNTSVYILNNNNQVQPIGVPGELYIGGEGVARGYLARPKLTAEKFVSNPFKKGDRIYRSGDIARWLPNGTIEYLERTDNQVKIRGFRVEIGEIEAQLFKVENIKEVIVVDYEYTDGEKYLCAYYVSDEELLQVNIRHELAQYLPSYMIPACFIKVPSLPLNLSGKVDRKALPKPGIDSPIKREFEKPRNDIEEALYEIWSTILEVKNFGVTDSFFNLGGSSLKITKMVSLVYNKLEMELPLNVVFNFPTIRQIALFLMEDKVGMFMNKDENVVLLKPGENREKHFFLIHDGSGSVNAYLEMVEELSEKWNFWGVKVDSSDLQEKRIEEVACNYLYKIKTVQAKGSYYIGGWSLGGTIAFEICRQLEELNDRVSLLAILDTPPPKKIFRAFTFDKQIKELEKGKKDLSQWKKGFPEEAIPLIPNFFDLEREELLLSMNNLNTWIKSQQLYRPVNVISAPTYLFIAEESWKSMYKGWQNYCKGKIELYKVPGNHFSIIRKPNVTSISTVINEVLRKDLIVSL